MKDASPDRLALGRCCHTSNKRERQHGDDARWLIRGANATVKAILEQILQT
jgi:hypothetical protein